MSVNLPSPALLAMLVFAEASRTRILKAAFFPLLRGLRGSYGQYRGYYKGTKVSGPE